MDNLAMARLPPNAKNGTMASYGDDRSVVAFFDDEYVKNDFQSDQKGSIVYDHYISIELQYPGNNTTNFKQRFKPEDGETGNQWTARFPNQWQAFKTQKEQLPEGTPIEHWPPVDKKRILELKAQKVFTVEQIAGLTDMTGPNIGMDWRKLRDMAVAYIKPNEAAAAISKLTKENEDLKNRLDALEKNLQNLSAAKGGNSENLTSVSLTEQPKRQAKA